MGGTKKREKIVHIINNNYYMIISIDNGHYIFLKYILFTIIHSFLITLLLLHTVVLLFIFSYSIPYTFFHFATIAIIIYCYTVLYNNHYFYLYLLLYFIILLNLLHFIISNNIIIIVNHPTTSCCCCCCATTEEDMTIIVDSRFPAPFSVCPVLHQLHPWG